MPLASVCHIRSRSVAPTPITCDSFTNRICSRFSLLTTPVLVNILLIYLISVFSLMIRRPPISRFDSPRATRPGGQACRSAPLPIALQAPQIGRQAGASAGFGAALPQQIAAHRRRSFDIADSVPKAPLSAKTPRNSGAQNCESRHSSEPSCYFYGGHGKTRTSDLHFIRVAL